MNKFRHGSVLTTLFLALVLVAPFAVPVLAGNNNPNKLHGAQTYLLNMLGKKSDWNGDPAYDSNRRTMFFPENVTEFLELNPAFSDPDGDGEDGVNIWVDKGAEFAVTDPNAFDDGHCNQQSSLLLTRTRLTMVIATSLLVLGIIGCTLWL
jgi:hypothetical protein